MSTLFHLCASVFTAKINQACPPLRSNHVHARTFGNFSRGNRGRRGVKFARNGLTFNSTRLNRHGGSIGEVEIREHPRNGAHVDRVLSGRLWQKVCYGDCEREGTLKYYSYRKKKPLLPGNLMPIPTICLPRKLIPLPGCTLLPPVSLFPFSFFFFLFFISLFVLFVLSCLLLLDVNGPLLLPRP